MLILVFQPLTEWTASPHKSVLVEPTWAETFGLKNNHLVPIEAELNCCVELSLKICESLKFLDQLGCDDTNVEGVAKLKSV